ncbi:NADH-ubiquinone oxidoreductase-F iron-sulfur binding region domain-containing protein [Mycobacterium sp. 852013-50091_SCH5140682]|uniref:NADH-ubiquinone oxidoreductase-F iron-sulfur binding region domain-containing protein n=1 Tax=Mycobacterium sp. 852013-50091_SCH5140682 TaxID=1834109 RepID=UPI001E4F4214|nr:NADH-ubiquinone oxidoreductase-F iron-sulfur binding region domain-containing protein [Mycobacterium sp. 852013-50091_SCH5140682]
MMTIRQDRSKLSRLLVDDEPGFAAHQRRLGALPEMAKPQLLSVLTDAGLRGRGGAGFPAARKLASVTGDRPVVVANGAEGEPLSRKDAVLLTRAPHLVLDGLELAAKAVSADKTYLYLPAQAVQGMRRALDERSRAGICGRGPTIVEAPDRFIAGEESALVRRIEGGPALPRDRVMLTVESGVRRRPTLVNNVETLAHIALIARFGPAWFRSVGDRENPGTMLVTLSGAVNEGGVVEVATSTTLADLIGRRGAIHRLTVQAALVGGYHGTWVPASAFDSVPVSGLGIVHALGARECGLARTAKIAGYLAEQSAGQCGPCRIGLPRLVHLLDRLDHADNADVGEIYRLLDLVDGRGACRHPDGAARMIRSALEIFAPGHRRGAR